LEDGVSERVSLAGAAMNKFDKKQRQRRLIQIKAASKALDGVVFSALERPNVRKGAAPTRELIYWAVRVYCFSILSHFRELLRSFLYLIDSGYIPAAFVVARCLFEMGANSYYVHKHVTQYLDSGDLEPAWEFLSEINMGSRLMRKRFKDGKGSEFPEPRDVAKVVRCFNEWVKKDMVSTYSYLSEFSHADMAAYSHYHEFKLGHQNQAKCIFVGPQRDPLAAPIPEVAMSITALLHFVKKLLVHTEESAVALLLDRALREHIKEIP
jgi:hypothetical protein